MLISSMRELQLKFMLYQIMIRIIRKIGKLQNSAWGVIPYDSNAIFVPFPAFVSQAR